MSTNVIRLTGVAVLLCLMFTSRAVAAGQLRAGAAKVDITSPDAPTRNERLYARALVLSDDDTTAVIVAVDAVAIGEIGYIKNDYLPCRWP